MRQRSVSVDVLEPIPSELRIETPEGVELSLRPAGPVARGLALSIDLAIRLVIVMAISIVLAFAGEMGTGAFLLLLFAIEWFYPVLFEVRAAGQTPGKRALGLRVVRLDATPVDFAGSLVRNLLRVPDLFPAFYATGLVCMCCNDRFQRLGDLAAGTVVVHAEEATTRRVEPQFGLAAVTSPHPLEAGEQRALLRYAERAGELSEERRVELSDILVPLTGEVGAAGERALMRIAAGIAGS